MQSRFTFSPDWPAPLRWLIVIAFSLALTLAFFAIGLPAAPMVGPMIAAVILATRGLTVRIPRVAFVLAQGVVGVMIATMLPPNILSEIAADWPVFLAGVIATIGASFGLGYVLARSGVLPGTTAIWGSAPGAASAMTLMSGDFGADNRLVAFMLYLRVICVVVTAALVSRLIGSPVDGSASAGGVPAQAEGSVWLVLAIAAAGSLLGWKFRIPGGPMLAPMVVGIGLALGGVMHGAVPEPILILSYAIIGCQIGMRFTPAVVSAAARAFPRVLASIMALIAICACFGALLVVFAGVDPLTAFLATSPGGADSVTIIAASLKVDAPFVIAMQVARFLLVLILGPSIAKILSKLGLISKG